MQQKSFQVSHIIYLIESVIWVRVSLFCETTDMTTLKSSPKLPTTLSWYLSTTFFLWYLLLCLSQSPKISKKILLNLLIKRTDMSHKNLNWNTKMADMSTLPMLAIKRIDCQTSTMETQNLRIVYHFLLKRITIFYTK